MSDAWKKGISLAGLVAFIGILTTGVAAYVGTTTSLRADYEHVERTVEKIEQVVDRLDRENARFGERITILEKLIERLDGCDFSDH